MSFQETLARFITPLARRPEAKDLQYGAGFGQSVPEVPCMRAAILIPGCVIVLLVSSSRSYAQDAAAFFQDNCAMCHSIGGEPGAGPDLKDVTKRRDRRWLLRFIHDPHEAAEHDPEAAALVKKHGDMMPPTEGADHEMLEALLRYIDEKSAAVSAPTPSPGTAVGGAAQAPGVATSPTAPAPDVPPTPADIALGREIYEGRRSLVNGGPACVSCHSIGTFGGLGGGVLGPDLTTSHTRLGGARGLSAWLANPPMPVMRAVYRNAAFDPAETRALVAFLGDAAATATASAAPGAPATPGAPGAPVAPGPPPTRFIAMGVGGFFLVLAAMGAVWSRRFRSVRQPLVARARAHAGGTR